MVFAASLNVAGRIHLTQVNGRAIHRYRAGLDQLIIAIKIGQIASMPFGRQVGRVAIPVKQIEGRIILSQQIVVDDIRSEEHTSELQSLMRISYAVFCLKKKKTSTNKQNQH